MKIRPIAATVPHWLSFINAVTPIIGESPTRGLDDQQIEISVAKAFPGCLNLDNNPSKALKANSLVFDHVSITFIVTIARVPQQFYNLNLHFLTKRFGDDSIIIASGTINQWFRAICIGCSESADQITRSIINEIYTYLSMSGLGFLWENYEKKNLSGAKGFSLLPK